MSAGPSCIVKRQASRATSFEIQNETRWWNSSPSDASVAINDVQNEQSRNVVCVHSPEDGI